LQELIAGGDIKARSKWKLVYPKFSSDTRYLDMLGKPGSNPIELFWDVVDDLDQKLDAKIATVDAAIKRYNSKRSSDAEGSSQPWSVQPGTTEVEFLKVVQENGDEESASLSADDLKQIFTTVFLRSTRSSHSLLISVIQLHEQILKQQADEKRRAERRARHMQDDLRYAIKKLSDPLDFSLGYEEVCVSYSHTQCILTEL
jgi:pre-mRNA-processing factor 40